MNAERIRAYKAQKEAVDTLTECLGKEHPWACVIAFQNYPFHTISGLPSSYTFKIGRNEEHTKGCSSTAERTG